MFKNPVKLKSWKEIKSHFSFIKNIKMFDLFNKDKRRFYKFSILFKDQILFDYSKNIINMNTIKLFINFLNEINFKKYILSMFFGKKINFTENKVVLNFLLRDRKNFFVKNNSSFIDIKKDIDVNLNKIKLFTKKILNGDWLGYSGKKIYNIVNIGIGGSDIGPRMIIKSLISDYKKNKKINFYFVSNIDSLDITQVINNISPENTIFIVCSKTFTTLETLSNAKIARDWILNFYNNKKNSINHHFILISSNFNESVKFGVNINNIFLVHDWVGGRYSFCSAFGLIISLALGFENFIKLLDGAHDMDIHFLKNNYQNNIPIILAMLSVWYTNFFKFNTRCIIPYTEKLYFLSHYLQQLIMESNGKYIDNNGKYIIDYNTSPIIWGGIGTISQHSFYQLLHQGTYIIPCDFFAEILNQNNSNESHLKLMSNFFSQTQALAFGDSIFSKNIFCGNSKFKKFLKFKGNRPSNTFLIKKITPYTIGVLISMYEHKVFTQGIMLNICSFDQWGVELGKKLCNYIIPCLYNNKSNFNKLNKNINLDNSTLNLLNFFNKNFYKN